MLSKELEILKHIEELYKSDIDEVNFILKVQGKETQIAAWREAFEGYLLRDILDVIDEYFTHKNNRTPPRIAQIKAMLNTKNIHAETEQTIKIEPVKPCLGLQYAMQDREEGNMRWFTPDYIDVENLIRQDKWKFVQNIYHPTLYEFHRCLEEYCEEYYGKKQRFFSDNEIARMSDEQRDKLLRRCHSVADLFLDKMRSKNVN